MTSRDQEEQRRIARLALAAAGDDAGFALAGSGAIREHGLIDRPTEDVDLFTVEQAQARFGTSIDQIVAALRAVGYTVETHRRQGAFAQLTVVSAQGHVTGMDLGMDWRAHPPVWMEVGPVLAIEDAVGNKMAALFSRAETRDYLDVDAIRRSGRYSDEELLDLAREADAGFNTEWFSQSLENAERIQPEEVLVYGVSAEQLNGIKERCTQWAALLRGRPETDSARLAGPQRSVSAEAQQACYPKPPSEALEQRVGSGQQPSRAEQRGPSGREGIER